MKTIDEYPKEFAINFNEQMLVDTIDNYLDVIKLGKKISLKPLSKKKISIKKYLSYANEIYRKQIEHLRKLGADISKYPKSLEVRNETNSN